MAPTTSDQHGNNQPAPPHQDQTDQSPTAQVEHTEQTEQPLEQEVSIAIVTPWWSTITLTAQEKADFEKASRLARYQPLPDPSEDDFADEPLPTPYDPNVDTRYEWAKPEAYIQEEDSEGRKVWRNRFTSSVRYSRPWGVPDQDENGSTAEQHNSPDPRGRGSEGIVRK